MQTSSHIPVEPSVLLVEVFDPQARLNAHLELGRRALARHDRATAATHFHQAELIDPTDERPRAELRGLGTPKKRRFFFW